VTKPKPAGHALADVGIVVIGRNEGARLRASLDSVTGIAARIVYVDSGSTDGSVELARRQGVDVVELDPSTPFSAARARNAGHQRLVGANPGLRFLQFLDGDSALCRDWIPYALESLAGNPALAIVAGYVRERSADASIFNRLGELEWNFAGIGEVTEVGGIFMTRREAFESIGGFDATVPVGEEPELCQRLSRQGWRFARLDRDMAIHDSGMTELRQWWKRQIRNGYGAADVAHRFGIPKFKGMTCRARFWSAWPVLVVGAAIAAGLRTGWAAGLVAALVAGSIWPAHLCRIALRTWRAGQPPTVAAAYAFFSMISFWPQMMGELMYWADRLRGRPTRLLEHKAIALRERVRNR
jgi:GT2 family glycosyltransferase